MKSGGFMKRNDFKVDAEVINSVLDYIQGDMEKQEDPDIADHLIEIHDFLLSRKLDIIRNTSKDDEPTADKLLTYAYMIEQSLSIVFGTWDAIINVQDDGVIIYNSLVYIQVVVINNRIECQLALSGFITPNVAANVAITLRDIFGPSLFISQDTYIIDEATNEFIWGDEEIDKYRKRLLGFKVKPIVYFDPDGNFGNC